MEFSSDKTRMAMISRDERESTHGVGSGDVEEHTLPDTAQGDVIETFAPIKAGKDEGMETLGFLSIGTVVGITISVREKLGTNFGEGELRGFYHFFLFQYLILAIASPNSAPTTVTWSAAYGGPIYVDQPKDFVQPDPSKVAIALWMNISAFSCEGGLSLGVEKGSFAQLPSGYSSVDDIDDSFGNTVHQGWKTWHGVAPPRHAYDTLHDDIVYILDGKIEEEIKVTGFEGKPIVLFPLLGKSAVQVVCNGGSVKPSAALDIVSGTTELFDLGLTVSWPVTGEKSPLNHRSRLSWTGIGRLEARLDAKIDTFLSSSVNFAFPKVSVESVLQCDDGGFERIGDCEELRVQKSLVLRIYTPDKTEVQMGYKQGGWWSVGASCVGLVSGLLGSTAFILPTVATICRSCLRRGRVGVYSGVVGWGFGWLSILYTVVFITLDVGKWTASIVEFFLTSRFKLAHTLSGICYIVIMTPMLIKSAPCWLRKSSRTRYLFVAAAATTCVISLVPPLQYSTEGGKPDGIVIIVLFLIPILLSTFTVAPYTLHSLHCDVSTPHVAHGTPERPSHLSTIIGRWCSFFLCTCGRSRTKFSLVHRETITEEQ